MMQKLTECVLVMANLCIMGPNCYPQIALGCMSYSSRVSFCWKEHRVGLMVLEFHSVGKNTKSGYGSRVSFCWKEHRVSIQPL